MTTILLVEDNELNRDMLSRRLSRKGFEVQFALDGQEAVEKAKTLMPDLVLMDIGLPVLDGYDATRAIKSDDSTKSIPVIALTAHAMAEDRKQCFDAGCNDFDTKPIDLPRLLDKIHALLGAMFNGCRPKL